MEENKKDNQAFTEEESTFDIKEWLFHFLRFWYLFLIGILIALSLAYLKNRSWLPTYETAGTMIIESGPSQGSNSAIMQGFGIQSGYRNINNQVVMLQSYDLLGRVVDSLPIMKVDYINQGRFITRNLYKYTPLYVSTSFLSPEAYGYLYKITVGRDSTFTITYGGDKSDDLTIHGRIGEKLQNDLFSLTVYNLREINRDTELSFRFRSRESLVNEFYYRLRFDYVMDGSSILKVFLNSETPDRDIDFINKLCDIFIQDNLDLKNAAANKTINFIDDQLGILLKSLSISEGEMTNFRQQNQIIDVSSYTSNVLSRQTQYESKKRELELRETYLNDLVNYLNKNVASGSIIAPSSLGLNEPMLMQYVQQINAKFIEFDGMSEKNPFYDKMIRDIENLKNTIFEVVSSMRLTLNIEKDEVNKRLAELDIEMRKLPQKELAMIALERRYRIDDTYYTFFLQKHAEAEIQKASNSPDNKVLDRARIMSLTNGNTKSKTIASYLMIGILIPFLLILLLKLLNSKISSIKDVEKNSLFPVIGTIRKTKVKDPMLAINRPRSSFAEMFRVIRTRIEFVVQRKENIMMTVTSAESGDGKTYFSANLAAIYAMTQRKTILVDLDIRKPNVYTLFDDMTNDPGVTNYLIGESDLLDIIKHTEIKNYDILTTGPIPPNPGEIVRSEKMKEMFNILREHYDYIIVDTSPIGLVADAYPIALISDVNIFVTRMNKTNKNAIKKMTAQLKDDDLPNVYTIVNDIPMEKNKFSKYNSYGYGYYGYGSAYGYGEYGTKYYSKKKREAAQNHAKYYTDDEDI